MDKNEVLVEVRLIDLIVDLRIQARSQKNFAASDMIRSKLLELGVELADKKGDGTSWKYMEPEWDGRQWSNRPRKKIWDDIRQGWYYPEDLRSDISEAGLKKWLKEMEEEIKKWSAELRKKQEEQEKKNKKKRNMFSSGVISDVSPLVGKNITAILSQVMPASYVEAFWN